MNRDKNKTRLGTHHLLPIMRSAWQVCLSAMVLVCLALSGFVSHPVQAADPVIKLELGGEGATPWSITNIKPCSTGTKVVTLRNAGTASGMVYIWVSDIISGEGLNPESETGDTAEPGELHRYLLFNLTADNLDTNIRLPATLDRFPTSRSVANYIRIGPLNPGAAATLVWGWQLPCQTGNDVQGDTLSFTINYALEQVVPPTPPQYGGGGGFNFPAPPTPPAPPPQLSPLNVSPGDILELTVEIVNLGPHRASDIIMVFELPKELIVTLMSYPGFVAGLVPQMPTFTQHRVHATLLPIEKWQSDVLYITVEASPETAPGTPIAVLLDKASLVISSAATPSEADQPGITISKLHIRPVVSTYWLFPLVRKSGNAAEISATVTDSREAQKYCLIVRVGGRICYAKEVTDARARNAKDSHTVTLKIDGDVWQTEQISLARGESRRIVFAVTHLQIKALGFPGRLSSVWWVMPTGEYLIDVNGVQGELASELGINWLLVLVVLGAIGLTTWFFLKRRKPQSKRRKPQSKRRKPQSKRRKPQSKRRKPQSSAPSSTTTDR